MILNEEVVLYQISIFNVAVQEFVGEERDKGHVGIMQGAKILLSRGTARVAPTRMLQKILSVAHVNGGGALIGYISHIMRTPLPQLLRNEEGCNHAQES